MSQIADIRDAFEVAVSNTTIPTFVFDDLSTINVNDNTYPLFLLKLPTESNNLDYKQHWETYNIEFFIFDLQGTDPDYVIQDTLKNFGLNIVAEIAADPNIFRIENKRVQWQYGHYEHSDQLVGVKGTLGLKAFNCYEVVPTGITWGTWTGLWSEKTQNWSTYT